MQNRFFRSGYSRCLRAFGNIRRLDLVLQGRTAKPRSAGPHKGARGSVCIRSNRNEDHWHFRKSPDRFPEHGSSQCGGHAVAALCQGYGVDGIGNLPHFNPELDKEPVPPAVADFRSKLNSSAGVVISTPEYAHGVPGALKNALDWLVASGELYEKPVALFSPSPYARFAHASLIETLTVMMARLIPDAFINVSPRSGSENGDLHMTSNVGLLIHVESALAAFAKAIDPTYT